MKYGLSLTNFLWHYTFYKIYITVFKIYIFHLHSNFMETTINTGAEY